MIWMCLHCLSGTELRAFENLEAEWAKHPSIVLKQSDQILFCWLCLEGTTLAHVIDLWLALLTATAFKGTRLELNETMLPSG